MEFVNLRVEAFGRTPKARVAADLGTGEGAPEPVGHRPVCLDAGEGFRETPVYRRADLRPGHGLAGPAVITQRDTTTVVLAGQNVTVAPNGVLRVRTAA